MAYEFLTDIGGFLWWLIIRFGKTELKREQKEDKWARNLLFLIVLGFVIAFLSIKIF